MGANLYQRYIDRLRTRQNNKVPDPNGDNLDEGFDPELPLSRNMPECKSICLLIDQYVTLTVPVLQLVYLVLVCLSFYYCFSNL